MANRLERLPTHFKLASRFSFLASALNLVITRLEKEGTKVCVYKETANSNSYFSSLVEKIFPVCGNKICASRVPKRQSRVLWILIEIE